MATAPLSREYVQVWLTERGTGPWPCGYEKCDDLVLSLGGRTKFDGVVHHKDENRENNDISNLDAMHRSCHGQHHMSRPRTLIDIECPTCTRQFHPRTYRTKYCSRPCMYGRNQKKGGST